MIEVTQNQEWQHLEEQKYIGMTKNTMYETPQKIYEEESSSNMRNRNPKSSQNLLEHDPLTVAMIKNT